VSEVTLTLDRPATDAASEPKTATGLTIFLLSGDLERVWAALILSTTAAAMARPVTIFFTFWGLFPLVRNERGVTGEVWMQKMLSFMNRGGTSHLPLSKLNFMGAGPAMMRSLAASHHVAPPEELMALAIDLGVKLVPCQMTMDLMGLSEKDLIDGIEAPAGAATALDAAEGATTLFI
jgi:peroxiredoxin family protein